jgi:hypothetical protein
LGFFINLDGSFSPLISSNPSACPAVIWLWTNVTQTVNATACDPNFDFQPLIQQGRARVTQFVQAYTCPAGCPFKEFFQDPNVAEHHPMVL